MAAFIVQNNARGASGAVDAVKKFVQELKDAVQDNGDEEEDDGEDVDEDDDGEDDDDDSDDDSDDDRKRGSQHALSHHALSRAEQASLVGLVMEAYKHKDPEGYETYELSRFHGGQENTKRQKSTKRQRGRVSQISPLRRALMYDLALRIARSTLGKTSAEAVDLYVQAVQDFQLDWPEQVVLLEEHRRAAPLVEAQAMQAFVRARHMGSARPTTRITSKRITSRGITAKRQISTRQISRQSRANSAYSAYSANSANMGRCTAAMRAQRRSKQSRRSRHGRRSRQFQSPRRYFFEQVQGQGRGRGRRTKYNEP